MKRIYSLILVLAILLPLASCGGNTDTDTGKTTIGVNITDEVSESTDDIDTSFSETDSVTDGETDDDATDEITSSQTETLPDETFPPIEQPEQTSFSNIVFKQVYGTGYNTDTPLSCGFIELYNISDVEIPLDGVALSYMTNGDTGYKRFEFKNGDKIAPFGRYLIKCGNAAGKNGEKYESKYEVIRLDYYDAVWNTVIDNKSIKLAITDKSVSLSPTDDITKKAEVHTYFIAQEKVDGKDRNVISGLSKKRAAYRTENTISSGFKAVDYSTMSAAEISDVRPQYSGGDRNTYLSSLGTSVTFSHLSGFYDKTFSLKLTAPDGFKIYYTTDGSDPRVSGREYTGELSISAPGSWGHLTNENSVLFNNGKPTKHNIGGRVIKAYAVKGNVKSPVTTNSYFVVPGAEELYNVPFVSLSLPGEDFVSRDKGIYFTVMKNPFGTKERKTSYLEIFESDGSLVSSSYVEIAMNGNGSLGMSSKSMRIYFKADADPTVVNNPSKLKYDIFAGRAQDGVKEFKRLLLRNSGNDSSASHIRDGLMQALCKGMNVSTMAYRPSLVFVNGEFWGVYNIRERYDAKYFEEHYGVLEENLVMVEAPSPLVTNWDYDVPYVLNEGVAGDEVVYHKLMDYISANDMSNPTHYNYIEKHIDLDSFIDFFVCSMYMCNIDWPANNVKVWRNKSTTDPSGLDTRWRYVLCDMDMGMGLEADYNRDMFAHALTPDTVAGIMMNELLENETFRNKFIERFTYVAQTVFAPEKCLKIFEEYSAAMKKVIGLHFDRWPSDGGSMNKWQSEINQIKNFINKRAEYAISTMNTYFGIQPCMLTASVDLDKADLYINGTKISSTGYNEVFSDNAKVTVKIVPKSGYVLNGIKTITNGGSEKTYTTQSITLNVTDRITVIGLVTKSGMSVTPTVVAGSRSIFVLDKNGDLYAWGENDQSQLGVCVGKTVRKPMLVMTGVVQVETSRGGTESDAPMTAVLTDNGSVYTIGNDLSSQLGRGGVTTSFAKVNTSVKFKKISVGLDHMLLLAENGDVYGCGNNAYAQLGSKNYPNNVEAITKIASGAVDIAAGRRHSLYVTSDGSLYALGDNRWDKISSSAPETIKTPYKLASDAEKVFAGQHNSLYINKSGTLYYFGWRDVATFTAGQSNGKMNKIANRVVSASVMDEHVVYLTSDGNVYGFGLNTYGQISSDFARKSSPVLIADKCISASAGTYYTAYIKQTGEVIVRGSNKSAVIGNGSISESYTAPYTAMKVKP